VRFIYWSIIIKLLKNSYLIIILFSISLIFNIQSIHADIRSEGGVLNKKGIQWCEEEEPRYDVMGLELFLKNNHYSIEARVCVNLIEDELWDYQGSDRVEKLIERSKFYALAEFEESKEEAEVLIDDPTPTEVDPAILAIEQWRSGEINEMQLDEKLAQLGWSNDRILEMKGEKPISQEEVIELENTKVVDSPSEIEEKEVQKEKQEEIVEANKDGGCLIATATFDSELAPQVQFLREIRENVLHNTNSGKSFMAGFNQIYYLFSPTIADWERENSTFKEFVKITITPLLISLGMLDYFEINSEAEMIGIGTALISLNVVMYFGIPTLIAINRKKIRKLFF